MYISLSLADKNLLKNNLDASRPQEFWRNLHATEDRQNPHVVFKTKTFTVTNKPVSNFILTKISMRDTKK